MKRLSSNEFATGVRYINAMTTIELHPEFLTADGKKQFAVLPYQEFVALQEWIEDTQDLHALRLAREENANKPSYTIEEVRKELGIE